MTPDLNETREPRVLYECVRGEFRVIGVNMMCRCEMLHYYVMDGTGFRLATRDEMRARRRWRSPDAGDEHGPGKCVRMGTPREVAERMTALVRAEIERFPPERRCSRKELEERRDLLNLLQHYAVDDEVKRPCVHGSPDGLCFHSVCPLPDEIPAEGSR